MDEPLMKLRNVAEHSMPLDVEPIYLYLDMGGGGSIVVAVELETDDENRLEAEAELHARFVDR